MNQVPSYVVRPVGIAASGTWYKAAYTPVDTLRPWWI